MTQVINLLGGPSCGKSTLAAELYAYMKKKGYKVELVREVAKEWAWEEKPIGPFEQIAIIGEQIRRESSLFGKVDYIITDSPVMLGAFYFSYNHKELFMNTMVQEYYQYSEERDIKFNNFLIQRNLPYQESGRYETEQQAILLDKYLDLFLDTYKYNYKTIDNNTDITQLIV